MTGECCEPKGVLTGGALFDWVGGEDRDVARSDVK